MPPSYRMATPRRPPALPTTRRRFMTGVPAAAVGATAILGRPPLAVADPPAVASARNDDTIDLPTGTLVDLRALASGALTCVRSSNTNEVFTPRAVLLAPVFQDAVGEVALAGLGLSVACVGTVPLGYYVRVSATPGAVESTGVPVSPSASLGQQHALVPPRGAIGHAMQDDAGGFVLMALYDRPLVAYDPRRRVRFAEDFLAGDNNTAPGTGALTTFAHPWWALGQLLGGGQRLGGVARCASDGTSNGGLWLAGVGTSALATRWNASQFPCLTCRWTQVGTAAGTRRIGLVGTAPNAAGEPSNGIYFRHTDEGEIVAVARIGGSETTVPTGVTAVVGTDVLGVIAVIEDYGLVFIDGALVGNFVIGGVLPTVDLGVGAGVSVVTAGGGLDVDLIEVEAWR